MFAFLLDALAKWSLGYLLFGGVLWMLLVDELRAKRVNLIAGLLWTVICWPYVLIGVARDVVKAMGPR